jgi:hypothetical protein
LTTAGGYVKDMDWLPEKVEEIRKKEEA